MALLLVILFIFATAKDYIVGLKHEHKHHIHEMANIVRGEADCHVKNIWSLSFLTAFHGKISQQTIDRLKLDSRVLFIEEDYPVIPATTNFTNNATYYNWGLSRLSFPVPQADERTYAIPTTGKGAGTHIYVIDSGIAYNSTEFEGRIGNGAICLGSPCVDGLAIDESSHGTGVASMAAGRTLGVAQEAIIHPVKVFGNESIGSVSDVINAIAWTINEVLKNRV